MKNALYIILLMWIVFVLNLLIPYDLNQWGIIPRTVVGIPGIFTWIFLHGDFRHIFLNTFGLLILIPQIFSMHNKERCVEVILGISALSGLINWIIGTNGIHIGASGLLYGLAAYGLLGSLKQRNVLAALYSIGIMCGIGFNLISGLIPVQGISWTGHLSGLIAGIILASRIEVNEPVEKSILNDT
jgi:membrane associated rhomboid family serine protease